MVLGPPHSECPVLPNCLAEYTVHSLITLLGPAYRIGVVEQYCQMV